jgi:hypothetical protein
MHSAFVTKKKGTKSGAHSAERRQRISADVRHDAAAAVDALLAVKITSSGLSHDATSIAAIRTTTALLSMPRAEQGMCPAYFSMFPDTLSEHGL